MISFRPAQTSDLPTICTFPQTAEELFFFAPTATFPLQPEPLKAIISKRSHPTVALLEDELAGFATLYRKDQGDHCFIGNMIVAPRFRGCGVCKALVAQMEKIAQHDHPCSEIHLSCFGNNLSALLLYSRLGFSPYAVEERVDHRNKRVALLHMLKKMPEACQALIID